MRRHKGQFKKGHKPMGRSLPGHLTSQETRIKIGLGNTGKKRSFKVKKKMSLRRIGNKFNLGNKHSIESRKKMSIAHSGERNHFYGKHHTKKVKENLKKINTGKVNSQETREKISKANKGKIQSLETRKKISEGHIKNPNRKFKETGIELKIRKELENRKLNFIKQYSIPKIAIVDFYLPEYNIIIQCDGCFYHCCPDHYPKFHYDKKARDFNQDIQLRLNGLKVYRFWEHDINKSPIECINKIKEII